MRVGLVILHADPARGGAERYTFDLAQALAPRGHEVALIASTFGPRPAGVECVELGRHGVTRLGQYREFLERLDFHVDGERYDVVHAMLPVRRCDVYHPHAGLAAEAVRSGHSKHAGAVRRLLAAGANRVNVKRNAFARVERRLLDGAAAGAPVVLCLSEYVKATVRRRYPDLPDDRLATLFNAVDLSKYDPAARPDAGPETRRRLGLATDDTVALIVAQDFERKGLREAIEAVAALPAAERPRLIVVGKGDAGPYRQAARAAGVAERVTFAGPTDDAYAFYAAADCFVLPTRHDPCSLVVLEALAMGVPVVSTRQNGACEVMADGAHGFVLESADDHAGLVRAMAALDDRAARERMRRACLALRPQLAYEAHVATLERVYQGVAAEQRR